jgi:bifunctional non-homologous end joining protein LigD
MRALPVNRVVLDGEVVCFDENGRPSFQRLQGRMTAQKREARSFTWTDSPVTYVVFDLLALGPLDLRSLPVLARKTLLVELIRGKGAIRVLDHVLNDGRPIYAFCTKEKLEGVIAKRADSVYISGPKRTGDWIKVKCERDEEFVVIAYTQGEGARRKLGSLDLGAYDKDAVLQVRGRAGSGLDDRTIDELLARLEPIAIPLSAAEGAYEPTPRRRTFVKPEIVVNVSFGGWTDERRLRHPVFRGVRHEVKPEECKAAPPFGSVKAAASGAPGDDEESAIEQGIEQASAEEHDAREHAAEGAGEDEDEYSPDAANADDSEGRGDPLDEDTSDDAGSVDKENRSAAGGRVRTGRASATLTDMGAARGARWRVTVSNPNKIFWPNDKFTKKDLCDYYIAVAPFLLPHLRDRPVVLVRYPDGIAGKNFYQWNVPQGTPSWVKTLTVARDEEGGSRVTCFIVNDPDTLLYIANLGCIPIHVLAARSRTIEMCDFITFDFDIGSSPIAHAVELALSLRRILTELGLVGYPKTSGQSGLHVLVPMGPGVAFAAAKALVELIGRLLERMHFKIATMERRIRERNQRVYIDTGQTGRSRTIVAPYSVRAHEGATVSTPLDWDEVNATLSPTRWSILSLPARLEDRGDPMKNLLAERPNVVEAVKRLEEMVKAGS